MKRFGLFILLGVLLTACAKDVATPDEEVLAFPTPTGFPAPTLPENNPLTKAKIRLGKKLFYDPILSKDSTISCSSCHQQASAFADPRQFSLGVENRVGFRNAQPLFNLAWNPNFFWDGGVTTMELVPLNAIAAHFELDNTPEAIVSKLNRNPKYIELFRNAFNDTATTNHLLHALASFQRMLISADAPFDDYLFRGKTNAVSEAAKRGRDLFFNSKTDCFRCHSGFNYTNYSFQSNGSSETYPDSGRQRITLASDDRGRFQVPSLRNIEFTAPYMHDGSIPTLDSVVGHYNRGGLNFPGKSPVVRPLNLTAQERSDLVEFMKSLSDTKFLNNPEFQPEE